MRFTLTDPGRYRHSLWLRSAVAVIGLIGTAFVAPAPVGATPEGDSANPIATVTTGAVRGIHADGIDQYLGIPFAASTAGADRFAPPRPAPSWTGVRPADTHGPQCPQSPPLPNLPDLQPSSEDCLSIDLYVPEHASGATLPVMVWLYGGAFVLGSNAQYDSPARLVREGQVIVAVPNYRVGPFGFLALPELAAADGGSTGTYGTLDQQAALRWIRDNAPAFGGDPGNVTLFGESAGGMSVCTQLASPSARGLYAKAIVESGSCARSPLAPPTTATAYQRSGDYAASLGCGDPATRLPCLRALPVDRLLSSPTTALNTMAVTWSPVRDDVVITSTPEDALADGVARGVPLIVGSNAGEGATFLLLLDYLHGTVPGASDYRTWVRGLFDDATTARVLARYPLPEFDSPTAAKTQVITDGFFACPALFTTRAARRGGATVWQYQFNDAPLGWNPLLPGAFHGAEVPYVFSALMGVHIPLPASADLLSLHIQQSWAHFAHTGDPRTSDFTPWPSDTSTTTLELGSDRVSLGDNFSQQHRCDLWSDIDHVG
ncbi:carboxylesterase family protein [Nocardia sp. NBC_01503]|uniref:carboxylesterase/lipase family protein n=1 Tax=Nocardia sp. NBC_01503 TaxID=2975997 RepID=UPI002E7BE533|nr:carboxylesterase family protein [Nocardia sp. NBC_01503]WTL31956.1 carboxylesterase family protein [Nocardia sp. NBC_01503]